mmetsp:Transcript_7480/g.21281  ORF Transcript_7480/g.21281 Transcript_7480/m.21281 type:complete len:240 (+) Transcript_7480:1917-2636(+)
MMEMHTTPTPTSSRSRSPGRALGARNRASRPRRKLKKDPSKPPNSAVATRKGTWSRNCALPTPVSAKLCCWKGSRPTVALERSVISVNVAKAHARKHLQVSLCDQKEAASSQANITPPMGAPKAAARPAAAPAEMNSRWSLSPCSTHDSHSSSHWPGCGDTCPPCLPTAGCSGRHPPKHPQYRPRQRQYVKLEATAAPMCTMGPSGPSGRLEATAATVPRTLTTSTRNRSSPGMWFPLR